MRIEKCSNFPELLYFYVNYTILFFYKLANVLLRYASYLHSKIQRKNNLTLNAVTTSHRFELHRSSHSNFIYKNSK